MYNEIYRIFQYVQTLQGNLHKANESIPYLKDVLTFEKEAGENKEESKGLKSFKFNNNLEFRNVSFCYNTDKTILTDLNFNIAHSKSSNAIRKMYRKNKDLFSNMFMWKERFNCYVFNMHGKLIAKLVRDR